MADFASKSLLLATGVAGDTCVVSNVVLRINGASVKYFESIPTAVLLGSIGAPELASSGVTLGVYGDSTNIPQITVDADGRITAASNIAVSIPLGGVSADAGQQLTLGTDSKPLATGLATAAALAAEVTARTDNDITAAAVAAGTLTLTRASGNLTAALPAAVTVVDDLVTGGTTAALSAQQGVALTAADIASGVVSGNTLTLTLKGGGTVTVDVTSLAADIHVVSGSYNAGTGNIDFLTSTTPLNDFSVPASALLPVSVNHSIIGNGSTTPLSLVSDQATPAGSLAYGTSAAGAKGWVDVNALLDPTNNGVPATGTYVLGYINGVGPQLVPVV